GLPKSDPGHWWSSFFFGKPNQPTMTTLTESPNKQVDFFIYKLQIDVSGTFHLSDDKVTCGLAKELMAKPSPSEPSKPEAGASS
ncbi:PDPFB factor, partial [Polyodon spathula]|nr:PDPFB factor [Polyodon spathula]